MTKTTAEGSEETNASSDQETQKSDEQDESGVSYGLIFRATSFTDFENLQDSESIESEIARGRGKGYVNDVRYPNEGSNGDEDFETGESVEYNMTVEEGRLKSDTGFFVRFIDKEKHSDLTPFDVISLDSLRDYPAPETMIESLPPGIKGRLREKGYVKVRGAYSQDDSRFYGVQHGWVSDETPNPWDRIMEVISKTSSDPAAIDYTFVNEGPERWGVEEVSESRGVEERSVQKNVRAIENELNQ